MKKNIGTAVTIVFVLLFIVSIGATLSAFKVAELKVDVAKISVETLGGIVATNKEGEEISQLKVKSSAVGIRPSTGEEMAGSDIPSTINDEVGTEGAYASFCVTASSSFNVVLKGCSVSAGGEENLDNIKIAMMEENGVAINGSDVGAVLWTYEPAQNKELSIVVWLDPKTTASIAGGKIEITISLEPV